MHSKLKIIIILLKKIIVFLLIISMVWTETIFAATAAKEAVSKVNNTKAISKNTSSSIATEKVSNADENQGVNSNPASKSSVSASSAIANLVGNDLSANYSVNLFTGSFYNNDLKAVKTFTITASYNSNNNGDFFGIGTGWSLNIPFLTFNTSLNDQSYQFKQGDSGDILNDLNTKKKFPDIINIHAGGQSIAVEPEHAISNDDQAGTSKVIYVPIVKVSNNANIRLIAEYDATNIKYTFTIKYLNNPNSKIVFTLNKDYFNNIQGDNLNYLSDTSIAVTADIYTNNLRADRAIHIDYQDANHPEQGLIIYGDNNQTGENQSNTYVKLNNIFPGILNLINKNFKDNNLIYGSNEAADFCFISGRGYLGHVQEYQDSKAGWDNISTYWNLHLVDNLEINPSSINSNNKVFYNQFTEHTPVGTTNNFYINGTSKGIGKSQTFVNCPSSSVNIVEYLGNLQHPPSISTSIDTVMKGRNINDNGDISYAPNPNIEGTIGNYTKTNKKATVNLSKTLYVEQLQNIVSAFAGGYVTTDIQHTNGYSMTNKEFSGKPACNEPGGTNTSCSSVVTYTGNQTKPPLFYPDSNVKTWPQTFGFSYVLWPLSFYSGGVNVPITRKNYLSTLDKITWKTGASTVEQRSVTLNYKKENGNVKFVHVAGHITDEAAKIYGISDGFAEVPLLEQITEASQISPTIITNFSYDIDYYKTFYSGRGMVKDGIYTPLTQELSYYVSGQSGKAYDVVPNTSYNMPFYYITKVSRHNTNNTAITEVSYSFGTHNVNDLGYTNTILINNETDTNRVIRGQTSFFAVSNDLVDKANYDNNPNNSSTLDLTDKTYSIIKTEKNNNTTTTTTSIFNNYGLKTEEDIKGEGKTNKTYYDYNYSSINNSPTCPNINSASCTQKAKDIHYFDNSRGNNYIDAPIQLNLLSVRTYAPNDVKLTKNTMKYDDKGRPNILNSYGSDGSGGNKGHINDPYNKLLSSTQIEYNDNTIKDSDGLIYTVPSKITRYELPFNNSTADKPISNVYSEISYDYKQDSNNNVFLDKKYINISGLKYQTLVYHYDSLLRIDSSRVCVANSPKPNCNIADTTDNRYAKTSYIKYNNDRTIESYSNQSGSYSKVTLNDFGQVVLSTSSSGITTTTGYDYYSRPIKVEQIDKNSHILSNNNVTYSSTNSEITQTLTDMYGNKSQKTINALGQVKSVTGPNLTGGKHNSGLGNNTVTYSYDNVGNEITSTSKINNTTISTITSTYDYLNRALTTITSYPAFTVNANSTLPERSLPAKTIKQEYAYNSTATTVETKMGTITVNGDDSKLPTGSLIGNNTNNNVQQYRYVNDFTSDTSTNYYTPPKGSEITLSSQKIDYFTNNIVATLTHTSFVANKAAIVSVISYDKIGRIISKKIKDNSNTLKPKEIIYNYDDLDRIIGAKYSYNNSIETIPFYLYYNDDGSLNSRTYTDSNTDSSTTISGASINNLIQYNYKNQCLISSGCTNANYKNAIMLDNIKVYTGQVTVHFDKNLITDTPTASGTAFNTTTYVYDKNGLLLNNTISEGNKTATTNYTYGSVDKEYNTLKKVEYTNSSGVKSSITRGDLDKQGRNASVAYNSGTGNTVTNTFTFDALGLGTISESKSTCNGISGCDSNNKIITENINIDPRTGALLGISKILPNNIGYLKNFNYDEQGRIINILTTDLKDHTISGNFYNKITYEYSTSNDINYGALSSTVTNYVDKNYNITTNYSYNNKGLLSSRAYSIAEPTDPDNNNLTTKNSKLLTENYTYDNFNRLTNFGCAEGNTGNNMCPADQFSNNMPIKSRIFHFTDAYNTIDYNRIASIDTTTQQSSSNYHVQYKYLNSFSTGGISDNIYSILGGKYDMYFISDKKTQRITAIQSNASKNIYDIKYDIDGRVNSIQSVNGASVSDTFNITRGVGGITNLSAISNVSSSTKVTNNFDYYGNGLYNNTNSSTNLNSLYQNTNNMNVNLNNNQIMYSLQDINGRVLSSQSNANQAAYKNNNSYSAYGNASQHSFEYDKNQGDAVINSPNVFYGENGALTVQLNSSDQFYKQQFQILGDRVYMAGLGSFTQYDSISPFGMGGINGWSYSSANPVGYSDPSGHWGSIFNSGYNNNISFNANTLPVKFSPDAGIIALYSIVIAQTIATFGLTAGASIAEGAAVASAIFSTEGAFTALNVTATSLQLGGYISDNSTVSKSGDYLGDTLGAIGVGTATLGMFGSLVDIDDTMAVSQKIQQDSYSPPPGCFTGDTRVLMIIAKQKAVKDSKAKNENNKEAQKSLIKIKDVKVGMIVVIKVKDTSNK